MNAGLLTEEEAFDNPIMQKILSRIKGNSAFIKTVLSELFRPLSGQKIVNISDPNLYLDIQNFIEEKGVVVEKQLNSKLLQIRAEYYIDLVISLEEDATRKEITE